MHRLSQGHRPQATRHDRRTGVAVAMASGTTRRAFLLSGAAVMIVPFVPGSPISAAAQNATADARPVDPGRFLAFAYSSAVLQERASALAASRDTRPEVKEFAGAMARFRE